MKQILDLIELNDSDGGGWINKHDEGKQTKEKKENRHKTLWELFWIGW